MISKFYSLLTICFFFFLVCFSQNQTNIWYFGFSAGVDFNSGSPVSISGGQTSTVEGTAVMCDDNGDLLFYTDGVSVWNKNHSVMSNGYGLDGDYSSSQSALIVAMPGSDSLYYIFTTPAQGGPNGFRYSIVDISLNAGLGDVTTKNELLYNSTTEKVTATINSNGTDVWILSHEMYSDSYYAYSLTSTGLDVTPVISNVGSVWSDFYGIGCMKASPDGSKVASAIQYMDNLEIVDFDNSTGICSNAVTFPSNYAWTYGVEFSPDSKILYFDKYGGGSILYQVDLLAGNATDIINSTTQIAVPSTSFCGALQLAPDGKIYMANYGFSSIAAVNNPDVWGSGCDYVDVAVSLTGSCELGLPNYSPTLFYVNPLPEPHIGASTVSLCQKFCIDYYDSTNNNPTSWHWDFPGGAPAFSDEKSPTSICYSEAGVYDVTLKTCNSAGCDSVTFTSFITVNPTPAFPTITQNGYTLTASSATMYQWQLNSVDIPGATDQLYAVTQTGLYTVVIYDEFGCKNSASLNVTIVGIDETESESGFSVFPNPSDGNFTILYGDFQANSAISVRVFNSLGQVYYSSEEKNATANWKKNIDLNDVASGIYFIEIRSNDQYSRNKILVTK